MKTVACNFFIFSRQPLFNLTSLGDIDNPKIFVHEVNTNTMHVYIFLDDFKRSEKVHDYCSEFSV